ncbi:MAG: HlyD family efflux transporter periplasmic adaptor subunit [Phycisphaeraceae bacterium]|nr:HlyD family efflux transporter periplasmic adaptor subunit [Phycisphaeraceae bacterium]
MTRSNAVQKRRGAVTTWIVVGLVLAAGAAVSYMAFSGGKQEGSGTVVSVRNSGTADIVRAQRQPFEISTVANGELDARRRAEYRNPLDQASTIVDVVPEGTRVSAGDLLIQLNVEEIQLKVDEESLRVEAARAELVAAQNNVEIQRNENDSRLRQAELKHLLAELALAQWKDGDVQKKRRELQLDIDRATLELERLAQLYLRSQDLHAEGFLSKDQMDRDEVQYIEAIARFKTSKLSREVYESFEYVKDEKKYLSDVEESRAEINRVRLNSESELANKLAQLENRRRQLFGLESRLAKLERQRDDATIRAKQDGMVVYATTLDRSMGGGGRGGGGGDTTLQIGTQVFPNQLLIILPDTTEMMANLRVHESMSGRVRPGQLVHVRVDAAGGVVFEGRVDSISVMAESGGWRDPNLREYVVRVALDVFSDQLKPAMRCEGRIVLDNVPETLTIPVQAIFNEGPVQFVYTPRGNKFARIPVRIGRRSDTIAEVARGLDEASRVLVREPTPAEILAEPWSREMLLAAGYQVGEDGRVISETRQEPSLGMQRGNGPSGNAGENNGQSQPGAAERRRATGAGTQQPAQGGAAPRRAGGQPQPAPEAVTTTAGDDAARPAAESAASPGEHKTDTNTKKTP